MKSCYSFHNTANVVMHAFLYGYDKYFLPGQKVTIRVISHGLKLQHVHYYWNDKKEIKKFPKVFWGQCIIRARVPKVADNRPVLTVIACAEGNYRHEFHLDLNNIY